MKKVKLLMIVGTLAISTPAFAQFSNASGSRSSRAIAPYDRISLSYQYDTQSPDYSGADDLSLNGFAIDYLHGFSISKSLPLYLETGVGLNYGHWSDTMDNTTVWVQDDYGEEPYDAELKQCLSTLSISVPVNLAYKFNVDNGISIQPYIGINLKFNALGKMKNEIECEDSYVQDLVEDLSDKEFEETFAMSREYNQFDKDEVGKDGQWKRFQIGWHIGAGLNYKAFYFGLSYGTDFMELAKKLNTSTFKVGVGYNF